MMSEREQIQEEIFNEVTNNENKTIILSPQEEVDMNDKPGLSYNYKDPNHKPPFKNGEDYTELDASEDKEINAVAFGKNGKYLIEITERNNMAYIYHNVDTNKIEIWGESRKFNYVILQIKKRYENAVNYLNNKKKNEMGKE